MLTKLSVNYSMVISLWCEKGCGFFDDNVCFLWFFLFYFKSVSAIDLSAGRGFLLNSRYCKSSHGDLTSVEFYLKRDESVTSASLSHIYTKQY